MFQVPNNFRIRTGIAASTDKIGNNGAFFVQSIKYGVVLKVIANDGLGWEHVSVSLADRCPTWDEMCFIKSQFWNSEDCVVQFHPPEDRYVNNHPFCLHLWRQTDVDFSLPDSLLVGVLDTTKEQK